MLKIKGYPSVVKCSCCGEESLEVLMASDEDVGYICGKCLQKKDYHDKNEIKKGRGKRSFSIEFETDDKDDLKQYKLIKLGFLPTHDGSIGGIEWKSPIFYSKKSAKSAIETFEELKGIITKKCGTHIHVGTKIKATIQLFREKLFMPLINHMKANSEETEQFWGRYFNGYARASLDNYDRYSAFSTYSKYNTIEFRLPKFVSKEQFYNVLCFCLDCVDLIEKKYEHVKCYNDDTKIIKAMEKAGEQILKMYIDYNKNDKNEGK